MTFSDTRRWIASRSEPLGLMIVWLIALLILVAAAGCRIFGGGGGAADGGTFPAEPAANPETSPIGGVERITIDVRGGDSGAVGDPGGVPGNVETGDSPPVSGGGAAGPPGETGGGAGPGPVDSGGGADGVGGDPAGDLVEGAKEKAITISDALSFAFGFALGAVCFIILDFFADRRQLKAQCAHDAEESKGKATP